MTNTFGNEKKMLRPLFASMTSALELHKYVKNNCFKHQNLKRVQIDSKSQIFSVVSDVWSPLYIQIQQLKHSYTYNEIKGGCNATWSQYIVKYIKI